MTLTRLQTLRNYLVLAQLDPQNNELYIEDLKLSIEYQKSIDENRFSSAAEFVLTEEIERI